VIRDGKKKSQPFKLFQQSERGQSVEGGRAARLGLDLTPTQVPIVQLYEAGTLGDKQAPAAKIDFQFIMVLASPHLPSLIPLVSTTPANKHMLASRTPHKLNGSYEAWHRIIVSNRQ
jgi:hypothetical protein